MIEGKPDLPSQLSWRLFQVAIVLAITWAASNQKVSPAAVFLLGVLVAALATGILSALLRLLRRTLGRETAQDRALRTAKTPRSPLAPPDHLI